jgi:hypothetical protein
MSPEFPTRSEAARIGGAALVIALIAFAFVAAIFQVYDYDVGYHLATGAWIDANGRLPASDPFSFTRAGHPWPIQQGASAWLIWRAHQLGGVEGLILFKAGIVALIYAIVFWVAWRESGSLVLACAATALGVCAGRYRFFERPMLFSALGLAALWACVTAYRRSHRTRFLVAGVAILTVWANLHAGWIDGVILLGAFALSGVIAWAFTRYGLRADRRAVPRPAPSLYAPWVALAAAIALSAISLWILNPVGPRVLLISFDMFRSLWFQTHVAEFQPLPPGNFGAVWALLGLTALALAIAWARNRARASDALVFGVFAWGTITVNRQMLPLSVLAPSILATHLALVADRTLAPATRAALRTAAGLALAAAMAYGAWTGFVGGDRFRFGFGFDERTHPLGAYRFIEANALPGEVWNEDAWGGSFLWHFWPRRRDFVDNRLEVFDEAFFRKVYVPVRGAQAGWERTLDRYGVNTLLMQMTDKPIGIQGAAFRSPRWALVYWDDRAAVYVRRTPATEALVARHGYRVVNPNDLIASLSRPAALPAAVVELERAVAAAPRAARPLNALGVAYGMSRRYADASTMFERALAVDPNFDAARTNLQTARRHLRSHGTGSGRSDSPS